MSQTENQNQKPRPPTEGEWEELMDERKVGSRRKAAESEFRDLGSDTIAHMRRRAKTDLFFLAHAVLGYDLLSPRLHGNLCGWMNGTDDQQYRLIVKPRNHYKTTVATVSDSVQKSLPNDPGLASYPSSLGPNIKFLIAHENRESASRFLFEITAAYMAKPLMLALFPECVPTKRSQRINKWELDLPREENWREPTFDTIGVGGAAQGRHYHRIKLDDLVGEDARDSETVMKRVLLWFDNVNSLLTRPKIDGWDLIGTFWAFNDVYAHALENYGVNKPISVIKNFEQDQIDSLHDGALAMYGRGMVENEELIFPEENSWEFVEILRRNPLVWAAQYCNNPRESGMTEFDPAWLRFYRVLRDMILWDDGLGEESVSVWDLDRIILTDPSMAESEKADPSGIVVVGVDKKNRVFVLETVKKRLKPPDLLQKLIDLNTKWKPRTTAIEEVAFSGIYKYWIEREAKKLGLHINISPYKPGSKRSKVARVRALTNIASAGQLFIAEGMHELRNEYETFPMFPGNIHLLDALAQGTMIWGQGLSARDLARYRQAEEELMGQRSTTTGY